MAMWKIAFLVTSKVADYRSMRKPSLWYTLICFVLDHDFFYLLEYKNFNVRQSGGGEEIKFQIGSKMYETSLSIIFTSLNVLHWRHVKKFSVNYRHKTINA